MSERNTLDPKGLEAAVAAFNSHGSALTSAPPIRAAITAYLAASQPADVANLVSRLRSNIDKYQRGILSLDDIEKDEDEAATTLTRQAARIIALQIKLAELEVAAFDAAIAHGKTKVARNKAVRDAETIATLASNRGSVIDLLERDKAALEAQLAEKDAALGNLIEAADKCGICDDFMSELFPGSKGRNGQPQSELTKIARRAMNEARAARSAKGGEQNG